ncbi:hypothetical protein ACF0H5_008218 [Mactra antiquata]
MSKGQESFQQRVAPTAASQNSNQQSQRSAYTSQQTTPTYVMTVPVEHQVYGGQGQLPAEPTSKKSIVEAYILIWILGLVGAHHFYLRRPGWGALYIFTFGLAGWGWFVDLFRLPYLVKEANKRNKDHNTINEKNISDAYLLWFPFGILGFHHFYLKKPGFGILYLLTLGFFGIGWLVDLFRIPHLVKEANEQQDNKEKQLCTAYALCLPPFGILGAHHFYLNRPVFGLLYFFTFGLLGVGWFVDWGRMPVLVKRANKHIAYGDDGERFLDDAYLLWFTLVVTGSYHFYLRRPGWGMLYLLTFGLGGVGWLVDGCRMTCLVNECNKLNEEKRQTMFLRRRVRYIEQGSVISPGSGLQSTGSYGGTVAWGQPNQSMPHPQQQQQQVYFFNYQQHYQQQQHPQQQGIQPPAYQENQTVPSGATSDQPQTAPSCRDQPPPYSQVNPKQDTHFM